MTDSKSNNTTNDLHGFVKFPTPQDSQTTPQKPKDDIKSPQTMAPAKPLNKPIKATPKPQKPVKPGDQSNNKKTKKPSFPKREFPFGSMDGMPGFGSPSRNGEDKTKNIKEIFEKVLGREPESRDLSYYRFSPMSEEEIMDNLLEGEEHQKLIEKGNKYDELKNELEDTKMKVETLQKRLEDNLEEFKETNDLLKEKNRYIRQLRETIDQYNETPPNESTYQYTNRMEPSETQKTDQEKDDTEAFPKEYNPPSPTPLPHFTDTEGEREEEEKNILKRIFRS